MLDPETVMVEADMDTVLRSFKKFFSMASFFIVVVATVVVVICLLFSLSKSYCRFNVPKINNCLSLVSSGQNWPKERHDIDTEECIRLQNQKTCKSKDVIYGFILLSTSL